MSRRAPTLLAPALVAAALVAACREVPLELDPSFDGRRELCEGIGCDALPRCTDGGTDCAACLCCPCEEGSSACDPTRTSVRWLCQAGCFVDNPCGVDETCMVRPVSAVCVPGGVDCSRLDLMGGPVICGETEALCAECGTCIDCADTGGRDACAGLARIEGSVLHCAGAEGCMARVECAPEAPCVLGVETGLAACSDAVDCEQVGCTGYPGCGLPAACGPFGCFAIT